MARFIARLKVSFFCIIFTDSLLYIAGLWLSMSPGTGASHFGIWGIELWLSMSPGTSAFDFGIWELHSWLSMSPGTGAFTWVLGVKV
ncbi:hypothetical protein EDB19DRAFT_1726521 [Suillus lakei]|nr:hypothetical protein EDB19DRAFT_1726521 [Suillus lakei]